MDVHLYVCIDIGAPWSRPHSVIPAVLRHFATFSPAKEKAPTGAITDQITRDKSIARKWAENEWEGDERGSFAGLAAERGGWLPWGNTATSREPRAGSGTAGLDWTGPTELMSLRGWSSFPNQASTEPWRAQRALLRGEMGMVQGRAPFLPIEAAPALPVSPRLERPFSLWTLRCPRGRGRGCRAQMPWPQEQGCPLQSSGSGWLCSASCREPAVRAALTVLCCSRGEDDSFGTGLGWHCKACAAGRQERNNTHQWCRLEQFGNLVGFTIL